MKLETAAIPAIPVSPSTSRSRLADYVELTKPRIAVMVLFTVAVGGFMAGLSEGDGAALRLTHAVFATALIAAGASALNQFLERHSDALMQRTENRPLPSGRLHPAEVLAFGIALGLIGLVYMAVTVRQPLAVLLAALTFVSYVWLYTPLKRVTTLNTLIGAVPGAAPPLIGWAAVRGSLGREALVLFLILFLWQVPHFLAIAWIYRVDYARAGMRMLPVVDLNGGSTSKKMIGFCLALIGVSLIPAWLDEAGAVYLVGALGLGGYFLVSTLRFAGDKSVWQARRVMRTSLVYLPLLLALLLLAGLKGPAALAW
jgi:protoheme IX farnesyltransferase